MMAHSDADANDVVPHVLEHEGRKTLVPVNASPYVMHLLPDAMKKLAKWPIYYKNKCSRCEWK